MEKEQQYSIGTGSPSLRSYSAGISHMSGIRFIKVYAQQDKAIASNKDLYRDCPAGAEGW